MPAFPYILRPATTDDLPDVVDLCMLVEEQHERYWPLRWQRRPNQKPGWLNWMARRLADPDMLILAALDPDLPAAPVGHQVVGALLAVIEEEMPIYTYTHYALIHDVAVRESHRRRGIAQALLTHAADWARGHHVNQVRLLVAEQNPEAAQRFANFGFRLTYHEMVLPLEPTSPPPSPKHRPRT